MRNDAAPKVWFVAPSDGDRLTAGEEVAVRVRSEGGEELEMTVNGTTAWTVRTDAIDGRWTPDEGRYRMVAVVSAPGRPDGVASIEVTGVAPDPAPAAADPGAGAPAPPAYSPGIASGPGVFSGPGTVKRRVLPASPSGGGPAPVAPFPAEPSAGGAGAAPPAPAPAPARDAGDRTDDGGGGFAARIGGRIVAFLGDPEKVAWGAALPVLLILLGAGYLLLQRFIDGGQKLAWRGRGRPDDTIVEF